MGKIGRPFNRFQEIAGLHGMEKIASSFLFAFPNC